MLNDSAHRAPRRPDKPSWDPRAGSEGSPQYGGAEGQKGSHYRGTEQDVLHHQTPLVSSRTVSTHWLWSSQK